MLFSRPALTYLKIPVLYSGVLPSHCVQPAAQKKKQPAAQLAAIGRRCFGSPGRREEVQVPGASVAIHLTGSDRRGQRLEKNSKLFPLPSSRSPKRDPQEVLVGAPTHRDGFSGWTAGRLEITRRTPIFKVRCPFRTTTSTLDSMHCGQ